MCICVSVLFVSITITSNTFENITLFFQWAHHSSRKGTPDRERKTVCFNSSTQNFVTSVERSMERKTSCWPLIVTSLKKPLSPSMCCYEKISLLIANAAIFNALRFVSWLLIRNKRRKGSSQLYLHNSSVSLYQLLCYFRSVTSGLRGVISVYLSCGPRGCYRAVSAALM